MFSKLKLKFFAISLFILAFNNISYANNPAVRVSTLPDQIIVELPDSENLDKIILSAVGSGYYSQIEDFFKNEFKPYFFGENSKLYEVIPVSNSSEKRLWWDHSSLGNANKKVVLEALLKMKGSELKTSYYKLEWKYPLVEGLKVSHNKVVHRAQLIEKFLSYFGRGLEPLNVSDLYGHEVSYNSYQTDEGSEYEVLGVYFLNPDPRHSPTRRGWLVIDDQN